MVISSTRTHGTNVLLRNPLVINFHSANKAFPKNFEEFYALPQSERDKMIASADVFSIDLNVHTDKIVRGRLDEINAGKITVIESSLQLLPNEPGVEHIVMKLKNPA